MAAAAATTDTGLWQYDVRTGEIWATEHCRSMFGLNANSSVRPQAFLASVHVDDRAVAIAAMQGNAAASQTDRRSEFRVLHPSEELRWYLATWHTDLDAQGAPLCVNGVFRNVTPRRKAEEEAARLSERSGCALAPTARRSSFLRKSIVHWTKPQRSCSALPIFCDPHASKATAWQQPCNAILKVSVNAPGSRRC